VPEQHRAVRRNAEGLVDEIADGGLGLACKVRHRQHDESLYMTARTEDVGDAEDVAIAAAVSADRGVHDPVQRQRPRRAWSNLAQLRLVEGCANLRRVGSQDFAPRSLPDSTAEGRVAHEGEEIASPLVRRLGEEAVLTVADDTAEIGLGRSDGRDADQAGLDPLDGALRFRKPVVGLQRGEVDVGASLDVR